jgi:hypothetical protein
MFIAQRLHRQFRRLRVLRSRLNDEERDMRPVSSKPFASVIYPFPSLVHCPTCDVVQPKHINGVQPALYCGEDVVFYQCTKCGNETTERVPDPVRTVGRE